MPEIIIIAAMAENRVIGKNNVMPWSLKEDMAHFRLLTSGWPCIMGRKTWESLPKKPLPGRLNIVISSSVLKIELCPQDEALSPRSSSVPKIELCPQNRVLSPKSSSVPKTKLCPQDQALSPNLSSVPKIELCPQNSPNVIISPSLSTAIEHCAGYEKIFICGGESIYRQSLDLADKIELTIIHKDYEGDTFFPEIDPACWTVANTANFDTFSFITYIKNKKDML
jgi:dihydrofolate reductase